MSWTKQQSWKPFIKYLYNSGKKVNQYQQFQIMVTTGYYLVIIFILSFIFQKFYQNLKSRKNIQQKQQNKKEIENNQIVTAFHEIYKNTFYQLIIFLGFYLYYARQTTSNFHNLKLFLVPQNSVLLIPFWFLSSRIFYFIGSILSTFAGINLKQYGSTLSFFTYLIILAHFLGYNLFQAL